jgi:hypothetical protein
MELCTSYCLMFEFNLKLERFMAPGHNISSMSNLQAAHCNAYSK